MAHWGRQDDEVPRRRSPLPGQLCEEVADPAPSAGYQADRERREQRTEGHQRTAVGIQGDQGATLSTRAGTPGRNPAAADGVSPRRSAASPWPGCRPVCQVRPDRGVSAWLGKGGQPGEDADRRRRPGRRDPGNQERGDRVTSEERFKLVNRIPSVWRARQGCRSGLAAADLRLPHCLCPWGMAVLDRVVGDTTITKVDSTHSPRGPLGQTYLATGVGVGMRLWRDRPPGEAQPETARDYETVGYVISGRAELHSEGQMVLLEPGNCWVVPRHALHTYKILEPFTAIEATHPPAEIHDRDHPAGQ
jgi:mannose-6-phosphate isomerase-like protein (cupin superfamily)